jgi:hypothetical protein
MFGALALAARMLDNRRIALLRSFRQVDMETVLKVGGVTIIFDFCQNSTIPKAYAMNDEDRNAALDAIISTHALRPTANDRRSG